MSHSAPGYVLSHHVPPGPADCSKIVNDSMPARLRFTAAAIPPRPAPIMATVGVVACVVVIPITSRSQETLNGVSRSFQHGFTIAR